MAQIFSTPPVQIVDRMASNDEERTWLAAAIFAETVNGYWLAWHADDVGHVAYLAPASTNHARAEWIDFWDTPSQDELIDYFESGEFESDPPGGLNMFVQDEKTGEWR